MFVDGGKKLAYRAAMAGMLVQNLYVPGLATTYTVASGAESDGSEFDYYLDSGNTVSVYGTLDLGYGMLYGGQINVYSGGTLQNVVAYEGGITDDTHIYSNTIMRLSSGGSAYINRVSGGILSALSGAYTSYTIVDSSGIYTLGGTAERTYVDNYGMLNVGSGALASNTEIYLGGLMSVGPFGSATAFTVSNGGRAIMASNAESVGNFTVESGGYVSGAKQASGAAINFSVSGGDEATYISGTNQLGSGMLLESGVASGFVLNSGAIVNIDNGGSAVETVLNADGRMNVINGTAEKTTFNADGRMFVQNNAYASSVVINNAGRQVVFGLAQYISVNSGGLQTVSAGGADFSVISEGGIQLVTGVGSASQTHIYGEQRLAAGTDHNAVIYSTGIQEITGGTAFLQYQAENKS